MLGTELVVSKSTASLVRPDVPKVLINTVNTKDTGGMDFEEPNSFKLFVKGKCDEQIRKLVARCGWTEEFEALLPTSHKADPIEKAIYE